MFNHGARTVLLRVKYDTGRLGQWARELAQRAPRNKVIVAVANKLARISRESAKEKNRTTEQSNGVLGDLQ